MYRFLPQSFFILLLLFLSAWNVLGEELNFFRVDYQATHDTLSVSSKNTLLSTILAQIAVQTGIEISMSPRIETKVTVNFKHLPIETGLKRLVRNAGVNHLLLYGETKDSKPLILALKVFPSGVNSSADLISVVPNSKEIDVHKHQADTQEGISSVHDLVRQRWEQQLETVSPTQKQKLQAQLDQKEKQKLARVEKNQKRDAKREQRIANRKDHLTADNQ